VNLQQIIVDKVAGALDSGAALSIHGGNSKGFYGYPAQSEPLDISGHRGVVEYDPGELVMTCRAGSRLSEIREILRENGQHFPFEPPGFGDAATIGGTVACGFSGPARPWKGSLRDYLLGVKMVNGAAEVVQYGGQVMKNVAGYDLSRLLAGSMGTLGVLLETSFKVLPLPARELTLEFHCSQHQAIEKVNRWSGRPLPLSGAYWFEDCLRVRLSGAESEVARAASGLKPDLMGEHSECWLDLREHTLPFFSTAGNLWRLSVPPATGPLDIDGDCLLDWGGAQRWYCTAMPTDQIRELAAKAGGHATLFRGDEDGEKFHPLAPALALMQTRIRQALDPNGVFNPGRMSRNG
jgi:glycolate oxidase FAD binding subunit